MELVTWAVMAVAGFVAVIGMNMISSDLYDRCPKLAEWLIKGAVRRLPPLKRARYREEWLAHAEECPGNIAKLMHAVECWTCVRVLSRTRNMNYSIPLEIEIVSESRERSKRLFYLDAPIYAVFLSVIGRAKSLPPEMAAPLDELKSSIDHDSKPDLDVLAEVGKEFERFVDISRQRRAAKESRDRVAGSDH